MHNALKRFFEAAECRTQVELAEFLGIRQSSISDAKKRGVIPAEWLLTLWRKKGVNPDWVLTGECGKFVQTTGSGVTDPPVVYVTERRPPDECSAQELVNELVRRANINIKP